MSKSKSKPMPIKISMNIKVGQPVSMAQVHAWHEIWVMLMGQLRTSEPLEEKKHGSAK